MIRALVLAGLVAVPAAVGIGVWAGQNQAPQQSVLAVRQNAPLVARPGRSAAAAARSFARLEPPPPPVPKPLGPALPPPPDVAVVLRQDVRALAPDQGRLMLSGARSLKLGDPYRDGWKLAALTSRTATLKKGKDQRVVDFFAPDPAAIQALAARNAAAAAAPAATQVSFTNGLKPGQLSPALVTQLTTMMRQSGLVENQIAQVRRGLENGPATQAGLMPIIMGMARNGRTPVNDLTRFVESLARAGVIPFQQVEGINQSIVSVAQSRQTDSIVQQLNRQGGPPVNVQGFGSNGGRGGFGGRGGAGVPPGQGGLRRGPNGGFAAPGPALPPLPAPPVRAAP
jgi:hypothetical protein